jgi:ubiquinone biosynthesis protein UbiJ
VTIDEWLSARSGEVPAELMARILDALRSDLDRDARALPEASMVAAETLLNGVMAQNGTRAEALDLLTVDALVTYAFEGAADIPDSLPQAAREAMRRLSAHAGRATA